MIEYFSEPERLTTTSRINSLPEVISATPLPLLGKYYEEIPLTTIRSEMAKLEDLSAILADAVSGRWIAAPLDASQLSALKLQWESDVAKLRLCPNPPLKVVDYVVRSSHTPSNLVAAQHAVIEWVMHRPGKHVGIHVQVTANIPRKKWSKIRVIGVVPEDDLPGMPLPVTTYSSSAASITEDTSVHPSDIEKERCIYCKKMNSIKSEFGIDAPPNKTYDCLAASIATC